MGAPNLFSKTPCITILGLPTIDAVIVCSCRKVSDATIHNAIAAGAASIADVGRACSAGTRCGGCWSTIQRMIDEHHATASATSTSLVA